MDLTLDDKEIEQRYLLVGPKVVRSELECLIRARVPVSLYFDEGRQFLLTVLLEVTPEHLTFDLGGEKRINQRLEQCDRASIECIQNGIKTKFVIGRPQRTVWKGLEAFQVPLPSQLLRLQRRECFRVTLPINKPLFVAVANASKQLAENWLLHDVSVEGCGFSLPAALAGEIAIGDEIEFQFSLAKSGLIQASARIRHITSLPDRKDATKLRIGAAFVAFPSASAKALHRYITDVERQRKAMLHT
ncbi:c-di-GMP-binding flagellar brake protein YcgR, contains PilZNR and PilZ domains [Noviherbaspirillum humi]|uniref:Flagellar brake protein YcgR n=1 Tax=Noviherbaspirillum humi TaxID=1688639 RepID=A0A239HMR7_9BURK|nr:flagellar brake protein [Noviherbaspirillum humi]SNS82133.1 c-di-GMP-binding flagellar brake protein YcgR, contains PilZNR and PilZ domains [Noviherbaspirillum humi]